MSLINIKCKHCGNEMLFDTTQKNVSCKFCGSSYMVSELLDEKDITFLQSFEPEEIERKIQINELLKNGEALIYQADYAKAEAEFKKVIELDDKNYHGYYGLVRAKTHNLTTLPVFDDYKQYAKSALEYVSKDDEEHIKSELNKLDFLEKERALLKKQKDEKEAREARQEKLKRRRSDFWSKVLYFLIFVATAIAIVCVIVENKKKEQQEAEKSATVEISTAADLSVFMTKPEYLSATIILTADIDFLNENWTPVGTALKPFTGKFYGNGHTISNINISDTNHEAENYVGLFGYAKNATIIGIKLNNAKILSTQANTTYMTSYAGLIVARADDSKINLCETTNSCSISITEKSKATLVFGGLVGYAKNSIISNCASHTNISGTVTNVEFVNSSISLKFALGGVVGKLENSGLSYAYASGSLSMSVSGANDHDIINLYAGGVVGYSLENNKSTAQIKFCFFTGSISTNLESEAEGSSISTAGIMAGESENLTMLSNFVLFNAEGFKENGIYILKENLTDASISTITINETEDEMIAKISECFDSEIWENTNTISPTLKSA